MHKNLILPVFLVLVGNSLLAQNKTIPLNKNKYRIELPDYWGPGNKVWKILTEKLPMVCDELKGKDLCGDDCNPKYSIEFYITEPEVVGYSRYRQPNPVSTDTRQLVNAIPTTNFYPQQFYRPLDLTTDPHGRSFRKDEWQVRGEFVFQCFLLLKDEKGKYLTKFILVDTNEIWNTNLIPDQKLQGAGSINPDTFFENNKEQLTPDKYQLLAIVDKKILAL